MKLTSQRGYAFKILNLSNSVCENSHSLPHLGCIFDSFFIFQPSWEEFQLLLILVVSLIIDDYFFFNKSLIFLSEC